MSVSLTNECRSERTNEGVMSNSKISSASSSHRTGARALSIEEFSTCYGVGRSTTYEEIKAGRLRARKVGKRTVIGVEDAEKWLSDLPSVGSTG